MNPENYHLEFFDSDGHKPVQAWLEELNKNEPAKHDALVYGLAEVLAREGTNVCSTEFGKNLKRGLYEFRLRHTRDELQAKTQPHLGTYDDTDESSKILLRVFFAVHGDKIVLLLSGYDKGQDPSSKRQNKEIDLARKHLKAYQQQQQRLAARERRSAHTATGRSNTEDAKLLAEQRVPAENSFLLWFRKRRRQGAAGVGRRR